jgi:hypothetical protein
VRQETGREPIHLAQVLGWAEASTRTA